MERDIFQVASNPFVEDFLQKIILANAHFGRGAFLQMGNLAGAISYGQFCRTQLIIMKETCLYYIIIHKKY